MSAARPSRPLRAALLAALVALAGPPAQAETGDAPVTGAQLFLLMFVDQGRAIGYQRMLAQIQLDTVRAELARDSAILERNRALHADGAIPTVDLEIAELKDAWNRKQLIVAEKSAETIGAQFAAVTQIARRFAGEPIPVGALYAAYRESWEAGCDKGPDEAVAMQARLAYAEASLARARELNARGSLPLQVVLEREAQVTIARSHYDNRAARLDRCRAVLFPSLEDILAVGE